MLTKLSSINLHLLEISLLVHIGYLYDFLKNFPSSIDIIYIERTPDLDIAFVLILDIY